MKIVQEMLFTDVDLLLKYFTKNEVDRIRSYFMGIYPLDSSDLGIY